MNQYREGKVKSTAMSGVKQFLKPDAYKQSELRMAVIRWQNGRNCRMAELLLSSLLISAIWVTAYLLYNGSASWS